MASWAALYREWSRSTGRFKTLREASGQATLPILEETPLGVKTGPVRASSSTGTEAPLVSITDSPTTARMPVEALAKAIWAVLNDSSQGSNIDTSEAATRLYSMASRFFSTYRSCNEADRHSIRHIVNRHGKITYTHGEVGQAVSRLMEKNGLGKSQAWAKTRFQPQRKKTRGQATLPIHSHSRIED